MNFTTLKKATPYAVQKWIKETFNLSKEQCRIFYDKYDDPINSGPFEFFELKECNTTLKWRITLPFFGITYILMFLFVLIQWLAIGKTGFKTDGKFKWFFKWANKIGFHNL